MAVEANVKTEAEEASELYTRILKGLEEYYRSNVTFGLLAEKLSLPVRSLVEFMQRYKLPYKGVEGDREKGIEALARMKQADEHKA